MKTTISAKGCSTLLTVKVMPIKNNNGKPFVPIIKIPVIKNCVKYTDLKMMTETFLSVPWLRICLAMQGMLI